MGKKNIPIGLDELHSAVMLDEDLETYDTPEKVAGSIQINVTPTTNSATLYADDAAYETATSLGDISVSVNVADIPTAILAKWLGHEIDANGVMVRAASDQAPYVALGYRRKMANGKYRYCWLYKGKFRPEDQSAQTKADTPTFQTPTINATFLPRITDKQWQAVVNEGDEGVLEATLTGWFTEVYESVPDVG